MWNAITKYVLRVVTIAALLLFALAGVLSKRGWLDLRRMERQNQILQEQISDALSEKKSLVKRLATLKSNPLEQERMVRSTLGYVRSDETIVEF